MIDNNSRSRQNLNIFTRFINCDGEKKKVHYTRGVIFREHAHIRVKLITFKFVSGYKVTIIYCIYRHIISFFDFDRGDRTTKLRISDAFKPNNPAHTYIIVSPPILLLYHQPSMTLCPAMAIAHIGPGKLHKYPFEVATFTKYEA